MMSSGSLFHSSLSNNDSIIENKNDFWLNTISQILFDPEPITLYDHGFFSILFDSFVRAAPEGRNFFEVAMRSMNASHHIQILKPPRKSAHTLVDILQYYVEQGRGGGYRFDYFARRMSDKDVSSLFFGENVEGKLGLFCTWFFDSSNIDHARYFFEGRKDNDSVIIKGFIDRYYPLALEAIKSEIECSAIDKRVVTATNITHNFVAALAGIPLQSLKLNYNNVSFRQMLKHTVSAKERPFALSFVKLLMHIYGIEAASRHNLTFNMFDTDDFFKVLLDHSKVKVSGSSFLLSPQKLILPLPNIPQLARMDGKILLGIRESAQFENYRVKLSAWRDNLNRNETNPKISYDDVAGALLTLCEFICDQFAMHKLTPLSNVISFFDKIWEISNGFSTV